MDWRAMQRHARRLSRRFVRKCGETKTVVTNFVKRSNSDYSYAVRSTNVTSTVSPPISDTEDDMVFEGTEPDELMTDDTRRGSFTLIPCEFCTVPQSSESVLRHQLTCLHNPNYTGRRRTPADGSRRRYASDIPTAPPPIPPHVPMPAPSAPPRSRSPSPTEGYTIPEHLICPITHAIFQDPVLAADGHTYERKALEGWLRTSKKSPMTRQDISLEKLTPNRIVKKMADEFRAECQRRRALYKYRLDVDVKKNEVISTLQTHIRTIYQAEWMKKNSALSDTKIILTHLTGANAEKIGEVNCQLGPHPNIVRTFGRVEHNESGILLLQEYLPEQTLANLFKTTDQKLPIIILDIILLQIASALQHLATTEILFGHNIADNIFIYQFDENPENILVKLNNFGDGMNSINEFNRTSEVSTSNELLSEKSFVYDFGLLARDLYVLASVTNNEDLTERENLITRSYETDSNVRPTFEELTKLLIDLIHTKKFIF